MVVRGRRVQAEEETGGAAASQASPCSDVKVRARVRLPLTPAGFQPNPPHVVGPFMRTLASVLCCVESKLAQQGEHPWAGLAERNLA